VLAKKPRQELYEHLLCPARVPPHAGRICSSECSGLPKSLMFLL
jgi:hypothetical protein